ncbi:transposase [Candidatus Saccharibacteria bacterium]|nr:MAG: transposase [Candidatus Saccharibacteria bacterium]
MQVVGFDVGKDSLFGARIDASTNVKERFEIRNNQAAITTVLADLRSRYRRLLVASESTAEYHLTLARVCLDLGIPFRLLNPIITKQFTRATVRKMKTDPSDAWVIAKLAQQGEGTRVTEDLFHPNKPILRTSMRLTRFSQILDLTQQRLATRLPEETALLEELHDCQVRLETAVAVFRTRARSTTDDHLHQLLMTIPGIGETIATTLIAEIGDITRFHGPKALVAFAGLDPRVRQSGYSLQRNTKLTKRGSPYLRRNLYIAASVAQRYDNQYKVAFNKKRAEGKRNKAATIVVARKILNTAYAVWSSDTPYHPPKA